MIELIDHKKTVNINVQIEPEFVSEELLFLGMRTLAKGSKNGSKHKYYHTIPVEHTAQFPVSFRDDGQEFDYDESSRIWLAATLRKAVFSGKEVTANIHIEKMQEANNVVILNCLDSCYGHALDKLFNAQRHLARHTDYGLIMIIHPSMKCLIPTGVSEIWEVDIAFKDLDMKVKGFDKFIKSQIAKYDKVYLSKADMNLDYSQLDVGLFTKQTPFSYKKMYEEPYHITLIVREDRFWLRSSLNQFLYLAARKFHLMPMATSYFVFIQNGNYKRLSKYLSARFPGIRITALGIGDKGSLGKNILDKRQDYDAYRKNETARYSIYANSHLILGVHGSHMLLPSALAGSFINIHQNYKIPHFSEDYIPRYDMAQRQAFLGRFMSDKNNANTIASHIEHLLTGLHHTEKNLIL